MWVGECVSGGEVVVVVGVLRVQQPDDPPGREGLQHQSAHLAKGGERGEGWVGGCVG